MAATRLSLFGTSFFTLRTTTRPPPPLLSFSRLFWTFSPRIQYFSLSSIQCNKTLQFHSDVSAAASDCTPPIPNSITHPWPEWVSFLDRLKSKGYFQRETSSQEGPDSGVTIDASDFNCVKSACMNFARERFDILRSLGKDEIQALVERGCPNLYRKAVNSAKRLRAYVRLDEGEVCSACNLRGACDRAYVIAKEDEGARTVDVVRVLLSYAMEQSDAESSIAREQVEMPARKLLSQLIELSGTSIDPSLPKPAVKLMTQKEKVSLVSDSEKHFLNDEMKRKDWICSKCNFMNFARNVQCLQCKEGAPAPWRESFKEVEMKKGDWACPGCNFMNFARNIRCLRCNEDAPNRESFKEVEMKKGDWTCPGCQFMNFARNSTCLRCQHARPKRQLLSGEWECPSCDFLNYRRNLKCLKCNCERPQDGGNRFQDVSGEQYDDRTWRKPKMGAGRREVDYGDNEEVFDEELSQRKGKARSFI
ncbi:zinc finger protein VAR3, chloroplastic [Aristolochia californica]|uniref:zinc finger protein VAR3, chloroplastic n=1 Tax=Aristolochia californica TaxID=171875 RepID=UPI0035DC78CE